VRRRVAVGRLLAVGGLPVGGLGVRLLGVGRTGLCVGLDRWGVGVLLVGPGGTLVRGLLARLLGSLTLPVADRLRRLGLVLLALRLLLRVLSRIGAHGAIVPNHSS